MNSHIRLLSLLDVKPLPLDDLIAIWNGFNKAFLKKVSGDHDEFIETLKTACTFLKAMCTYIGASNDLLYHIDQITRWADSNELNDDDALFIMSVNMLDSVTQMLGRPKFMVISDEKLDYFEKPRELFGQEIINAFHSTGGDVEKAGKAYASGRDTACVFHLMRVMEVALRTLGVSLNDARLDPKRNPSWETILKKCDEELAKPVKDRAPEWRTDDSFYSTAAANLRAVKDAWRNPTMHVEQNYTEETALEVWRAVRAFMRHLSTELKEA